MEELFNDIRTWNRAWRIYEAYRFSSIRKFEEDDPIMPKTSDDFILELNEKYTVIKK